VGSASGFGGFVIDPPLVSLGNEPPLAGCVKPALFCSVTELGTHANLISPRTRTHVRPMNECFFPSFDWPGLVFRDLSDRLNLSRDEGEKWIVNLIRETRMGADAKIDLEKVRCFLFVCLKFL